MMIRSHFGLKFTADLWHRLANLAQSGPQQAKRALVKILLSVSIQNRKHAADVLTAPVLCSFFALVKSTHSRYSFDHSV